MLARWTWLAELVASLAPPGCLACGRALARAGERLCAECTRALPWLRGGCARCGLPTHRGRGCPAARAAFPRAWAPLAYEGVARRLVAALKFRGALPAADLMAAHMAANLPASLRDPAVALVPVPAAPARRRARGFDPARRADASRSPGGSTARSPTASSAPTARRARSARAAASAARAGPARDPRARLAAAAGDPRRRRPHHGRDARRLRAGLGRGGHARGRGDHLRPHAVNGCDAVALRREPDAVRARRRGRT